MEEMKRWKATLKQEVVSDIAGPFHIDPYGYIAVENPAGAVGLNLTFQMADEAGNKHDIFSAISTITRITSLTADQNARLAPFREIFVKYSSSAANGQIVKIHGAS